MARFVTIEGYDGAGKSSLIGALPLLLPEASFRVVGRKGEPELLGISTAIEREILRPGPETEMTLRIALELERERVISRNIAEGHIVLCDRGIISLLAWCKYLDLASRLYEPLLERLLDYRRDSVNIVCQADFETCWGRIEERADKSRKEREGKDPNEEYFKMYHQTVLESASAGLDVVTIETEGLSVLESACQAVQALKIRGVV